MKQTQRQTEKQTRVNRHITHSAGQDIEQRLPIFP